MNNLKILSRREILIKTYEDYITAHAATNLEAKRLENKLQKGKVIRELNNMQNVHSFTRMIFIDISYWNCCFLSVTIIVKY